MSKTFLKRYLLRHSEEPIFGKWMRRSTSNEKGGRQSVNEGFGRDFYRKCNSVKSSGPFTEPPDSEN